MEEKIYKVILSDGTILDNLTLNGNNFVSKSEIDSSVFTDNLSVVTINDGENDEVHHNMRLIRCYTFDGMWWFILNDISKEEMDREKLRSDMEYLAMMINVDL